MPLGINDFFFEKKTKKMCDFSNWSLAKTLNLNIYLRPLLLKSKEILMSIGCWWTSGVSLVQRGGAIWLWVWNLLSKYRFRIRMTILMMIIPGNFCQVLWADTSRLGVGCARSPKTGKVLLPSINISLSLFQNLTKLASDGCGGALQSCRAPGRSSGQSASTSGSFRLLTLKFNDWTQKW